MILEHIIAQHAEDAAFLWTVRDRAVSSPDYTLDELSQLDERVDANVFGLRVAGHSAWSSCVDQLVPGGAGEVFAAAVVALELGELGGLQMLTQQAVDSSELQRALAAALGWVPAAIASRAAESLLVSESPLARRLGIGAVAMHRVGRSAALDLALEDSDPTVRARALRAIGELGRRDLLVVCRQGARDGPTECSLWAAWSAVAVGDRGAGLDALLESALGSAPARARAVPLALTALPVPRAIELFRELQRGAVEERELAMWAGLVGAVDLVPVLIELCGIPEAARRAGMALASITGIDLHEGLSGAASEAGEADAADDDPSLDDDAELPLPDLGRVAAWWRENEPRFERGVRYLRGLPLTREVAWSVLEDGMQWERRSAAHALLALEPGRPLFPWQEPAWRQLSRVHERHARVEDEPAG